jgi:hypothetical protein
MTVQPAQSSPVVHQTENTSSKPPAKEASSNSAFPQDTVSLSPAALAKAGGSNQSQNQKQGQDQELGEK